MTDQDNNVIFTCEEHGKEQYFEIKKDIETNNKSE